MSLSDFPRSAARLSEVGLGQARDALRDIADPDSRTLLAAVLDELEALRVVYNTIVAAHDAVAKGRVCLRCNTYKTRDHFRLQTGGRSLNSYCKTCEARRLQEWKKCNPADVRAAQARSRRSAAAKLRDSERRAWLRAGRATAAELRTLAEQSGNVCFYCGTTVKTVPYPSSMRGFDHVLPRALGGQHEIANIVVCCWPCNREKRDRPPTRDEIIRLYHHEDT